MLLADANVSSAYRTEASIEDDHEIVVVSELVLDRPLALWGQFYRGANICVD